MNITFLIGNGFDINLGLNTRYSDFYPYFLEKSLRTNMIKAWLKKDELLWADLEEQLGEKLENVDETGRDKFYEDKDGLLLDYLGQEQKRVSIESKEKEIADEFARSLSEFYKNLPEAGKSFIKSTCDAYRNEDFEYCFISFNYTDTLDQIVDITRKFKPVIATHQGGIYVRNSSLGKVLHIHGTLDEEMILGVNDIDQVNNSFLKKDAEFLDTFVKSRVNSSIGQRKTERAQQLIANSHIICIFGMSIGSTDKMWWEEIVSWLYASDKNILVVYYKNSEKGLDRRLPINTIRLYNSLKNRIFIQGGADMENPNINYIKGRILISYNDSIFHFEKLGFVCPF